MKKRFGMILAIGTLCLSGLGRPALAVTHDVECDNTFNYKLDDEGQSTGECDDIGFPCRPIVYCETNITSDVSGHNWVITGYITSASAINQVTSATTSNSITNYVFFAGAHHTFSSTDFPGVPSLGVDFSGVTANAYGAYSFTIPK